MRAYNLSHETDIRKNYFNYRQQNYLIRVWENIMVWVKISTSSNLNVRFVRTFKILFF